MKMDQIERSDQLPGRRRESGRTLTSLGVVIAAAAFLSNATGADAQPTTKPLTDVTLALDFVTLGRHAPWYVAQSKGYYREEGINTKIIAGRGTGHVLASLESGLAQFGLPDVPGLALARAKDSKVKIVAVVYQKSPYAIFSLDPGANVTKAEDLVGLELGSGPETFIPQVIQGFMKLKGLDPKSAKFTNIAPTARVAMLVAGKVPAIHLFTLSEPGIKKAVSGATLKMYVPGDHGLEMYSLGIGVTEEFLQKNPELVRGFVRASFRGWQDAMRNPEEAADIEKQAVPSLDRSVILDELGLVRDLVVVPDTRAHGYGWFSPDMMKRTLDFMVEHVGVDGGTVPKSEDLYAGGFLPPSAIKP
jgi:NitT/TauT family transport system substrate-binding protein